MVSDPGQRPPCPFRVTSWPVGLVICLAEFPSGNKAEMLVGWTVGVGGVERWCWGDGVGEVVLVRWCWEGGFVEGSCRPQCSVPLFSL